MPEPPVGSATNLFCGKKLYGLCLFIGHFRRAKKSVEFNQMEISRVESFTTCELVVVAEKGLEKNEIKKLFCVRPVDLKSA